MKQSAGAPSASMTGLARKVLVIVAVLALAAACGGAAGQSASNTQSGQSKLSTSTGPQPIKSVPRPGGGTTVGGGTATVPSDTVPALQGPPVIRQAQLNLTVGSGLFDSKLLEVRSLVESEGGYIAGTDAQATPVDDNQPSDIRTGTISFMVPAGHFDETIDQLSHIGKVRGVHISGQEVSEQYVDLNARLVNAEAQRDAMLALLKQATNINDIIAVQNQIGQITSQIEQLKGQIKYLDDHTSFSAITVSLTEAGAPAQTQTPDSWGFATALNEAAHNFVATIDYLVTGLGAVGPFLILLGVGLVVWRARRRGPQTKHA